jgi:SAM-dependent methyltransferase
MKSTGERQVSPNLKGIAHDHRMRYEFAAKYLADKYGSINIIDSACGVGYGSFIMARYGHKVMAFDISSEAIEFARKNYGHDNIEYIESDIFDILPEASKHKPDAIVSFETIEHVDDANRLMAVFSLLANTLISSVPNESVIPFNCSTHPFHKCHYTDDQFEDLLILHDFDVLETYTQYSKVDGRVKKGNDGRTLIKISELLGKVPV